MQFDWTTFALEGLNFLVLMWILTRFLYRPVLGVLDARQKAVAGQVEAARQLRADADAVKAQYEARLADWSKEREQARQAMERELAAERAKRLDDIKLDLEAQRAQARQRDAAAATLHEQALARVANENAYRQVSAMLQRLACAALTERIVAVVVEDLAHWDESQRAVLRDAAAAIGPDEAITVTSAHPLDQAARARLAQALQALLGRAAGLQFVVDAALLAGLRVAAGSCLLQASLADELALFREHAGHA